MALLASRQPLAATPAVVNRLSTLVTLHADGALSTAAVISVAPAVDAVVEQFERFWTQLDDSNPAVQAHLCAEVDLNSVFELRSALLAARAGVTRRRRGRPSVAAVAHKRTAIFSQVAIALVAAGVRLSTTDTGKFAKVAHEVFETLGVDPPKDIRRDLRRAIRNVRAVAYRITSTSRKSLVPDRVR